MNNKVKFHLIAGIINFLVFFLANYVNYIIGDLWDEKFGIRASYPLTLIQSLYGYIFFWLFTFTIYFFKTPKRHFFVFLLLSVFIVLLYENYLIFIDFELYDRGTTFVLDSLKLAFYDTFLFIVIASFGIHFIQLVIGKKFLPNLYKK